MPQPRVRSPVKWLRSGLRRDLCVLLYGAGDRRGQQLKADLEARYGERVAPRRFREALDKLVDAGHVERRTEGVHDVYALTEAGERAVETQFDWMREQVTESRDG